MNVETHKREFEDEARENLLQVYGIDFDGFAKATGYKRTAASLWRSLLRGASRPNRMIEKYLQAIQLL